MTHRRQARSVQFSPACTTRPQPRTAPHTRTSVQHRGTPTGQAGEKSRSQPPPPARSTASSTMRRREALLTSVKSAASSDITSSTGPPRASGYQRHVPRKKLASATPPPLAACKLRQRQTQLKNLRIASRGSQLISRGTSTRPRAS